MAASFILHHWDFRFRCGGLTYEITIDFSEIQDFFPEEVLAKRYFERPPEKDRLLRLSWENSREPYIHYTHDFYEYSFYPATKKFAETAKSLLKALGVVLAVTGIPWLMALVMSFYDLKVIEKDAQTYTDKFDRHSSAAVALSKMRKGPRSLTDAITDVFKGWDYGADGVARDELYEVINEMANDIYRVAELRLAAKARLYKVNAAQKRAVITASILPLPEETN